MRLEQGFIIVEERIPIPGQIASCPYCNGTLTGEIEEWEEDEDHPPLLIPKVKLECDTFPGFGTETTREWINRHSEMPYVYMLPVEVYVNQWVAEKYRCEP